jgi:hypothetical protein
VADACEHGNKPSRFIKLFGNSYITGRLLASQEELSSMEVVS